MPAPIWPTAKLTPWPKAYLPADWPRPRCWRGLPLLALVAWQRQPGLLAVLGPLAALQVVLGRWFKEWLDDYTGDCLGAAQQLAEALIYLVLTAHLA